MDSLRNARLIARMVLVWFALSLGAAIASPMVSPKATLLVCSGASMKVLIQDASGDVTEMGHHTLDCPLCAVMNAPPPTPVACVAPPHLLSHVLLPTEAARVAARLGAAWQARAPPTLA